MAIYMYRYTPNLWLLRSGANESGFIGVENFLGCNWRVFIYFSFLTLSAVWKSYKSVLKRKSCGSFMSQAEKRIRETNDTYKDNNNNKVTWVFRIWSETKQKQRQHKRVCVMDWIIYPTYFCPQYLWHLCGSKFLLLCRYIWVMNPPTSSHFPRCYLYGDTCVDVKAIKIRR